MSRRVAIAIGVSRVNGLQALTGVRSGVDGFEQRARAQGFEVMRFDDFSGGSVSIASVADTVMLAVDAGDVERMFVYFSGHGVVRGVGEEYWLLSRAGDGVDYDAVNIMKSVQSARQCGIPHVGLFGDACRSLASQQFSHVQGGSLFPNRDIPVDVEVDEFYATQFADPAYEVVADAEGIFSKCLIAALRGEEPGALMCVEGGEAPMAVLANTLRPVLIRNVRLAAENVGRRQRPSCRAGSYWEPNVLAWVTPTGPTGPDLAPDRPSRGPEMYGSGPGSVGYGSDTYEGGYAPDPVPREHAEPVGTGQALEEDLDRQDAAEVAVLTESYEQSMGRGHFETATGLSVIGTVVDTGFMGGELAEPFAESGAWHVRGDRKRAGGALLRIADSQADEWAGLAMLPGYIGVVTVTPTGSETQLASQSVDHLLYLLQAAPHHHNEEVARIVAETTARMRMGVFEIDDVDEATREIVYDDLNPSLAVLLASEWARNGKRRMVGDLVRRFEQRGLPVVFDLPVLAGMAWEDLSSPVVPAFPLLTGSWALVDELPAGEAVLGQARRCLTPALWTSFHHLPATTAQELTQAAGSRSTTRAYSVMEV